ncbi:hypothetical protein K438DRAFT_1780608 [Mycena galopus ATCC 62051]|nr:hypothetical protein K438DRAFT_1780608 [Mycena galopus ATCC 62051]
MRVRIPSSAGVRRVQKRNGIDLERTNKRRAHAPHNIRTRKGFAEGPARELAGEYGRDAERDAEGLQRHGWARRRRMRGACEARPCSQRVMERSGVGVDEETQERGAGVRCHPGFAAQMHGTEHRCAAAATSLLRSNKTNLRFAPGSESVKRRPVHLRGHQTGDAILTSQRGHTMN